MTIIALVFGIYDFTLARRVQRTTDRIQRVERGQTAFARANRFRICEREARDRAEVQFRAGLSPPAAIKALVKQLGLPERIARETGLPALRRRLPIFDCAPLLRGSQAVAFSARGQAAYVRRYASGALPATP